MGIRPERPGRVRDAHLKEQLHRPARERIVADRLVDDPKVLEQWSAPSTFSRLREYLDELGRR